MGFLLISFCPTVGYKEDLWDDIIIDLIRRHR